MQCENYEDCKKYAKFKIVHIEQSYKVQKYARCQIIQGGTFMQCETCMQGADSTLLKGAAAFK